MFGLRLVVRRRGGWFHHHKFLSERSGITARRGGRTIKKYREASADRALKRKRVSAQPQEMPGWFSDENDENGRKTTPVCVSFGGFAKFS